MSDFDLGQYKSEYSNIFRIKKKYDKKAISEDSPIKIYEAIKKYQGRVFLKIINKELLKEEEDYDFHIERIKKEKEISKLCNSEYTVKLIKEFETEKNIVFEKEYCDLDLKEYLFQNGPLCAKMESKNNLEIFRQIIIDIAKGLKSIHEKGVVHRNIKPHNIYLNMDQKIVKKAKIGDFSSAIYIKEINDSQPMGTILYTAPEIVKNLDYSEKCDLWSVGLTLFEIYFGVLPYGNNPNTKKMNNMIYDEKKFIYRKSNIHTLDILFKRLLQINPDNRMSTSEFYNYVTNEDFLSQNAIAINDDPKYLVLYQEIINEKQVEYKEEIQQESNNKEAKEQQDINKILVLVEDGNLPDIMSFANGNINEEEKFNNIIYFDSNADKYKGNIHSDSDLFERKTPGAFILCTDLKSLSVIRDEILKYRKSEKKVIFNLISNGRGYKDYLKGFLDQNKDFRECINKLCIYCLKPDKYREYKEKEPEFISEIVVNESEVVDYIKKYSSKDIKPFPLTKLVTLKDYLDKYKERHKKISEFYGDLNKETYDKNMEEIKKVIDKDEKENLLKKTKNKIMKGLLTFDIDKDLEALDELIIKEYTGNTYYGDLNRWLMKGKMKYYEPVAYFTARLMYSLNKYAKKQGKYFKEDKKIVHRGTKLYYSCLLPYERAKGKIILLSAFTSTSEKDSVAKTWAGRGNERKIYKNSSKFSVIFHITNVFKQNNNWVSNGIDIKENSEFENEKEILYQPFSFYKVTDVNLSVDNYTADIFLETIGKKEILEEQIKLGKEIDFDEDENIMKIC